MTDRTPLPRPLVIVGCALLLAAAPAHPVDRTLHVVAQLRAKDGRVADLKAALTTLADAARHERGCLSYQLLEDKAHHDRFLTEEVWTNDAALDAHLSSPAMQAARPGIKDMLAAAPTIDRFNLVD